jgi:hypothetical protein
MQLPPITKYRYSIHSRAGATVSNLLIAGRDEADARRKLLQMYPGCEVLECVCEEGEAKLQSLSFEDVAKLITR